TLLDGLALRMAPVLEDADGVQVLTRRHIAQGEGFPDHRRFGGIESLHVLDHLIAEAALVKRRADRGGAHRLELVTNRSFQRHGLSPARQWMSGSGAARPNAVSRKSKSQP